MVYGVCLGLTGTVTWALLLVRRVDGSWDWGFVEDLLR